MADDRRGGFCNSCDKRVVVFRKGTNHILHLLLTILTAGLWIFVWIGVGVKFGGWRCTECGSSSVSKVK